MARETVEKERVVEETVTETETLWRCDDCQREFDEEELVPVAVAPEVQQITQKALSYRVENELTQAGIWKREVERSLHQNRPREHEKNREELQRACKDVARELLKEVEDGRSYDAASVLDVCGECLEDDFGITVDEHDGRLFEERNYEETVEKTGLGAAERGTLTVISVILMGQFYMLGTSEGPLWYAPPLLLAVGVFLYVAMS